MQMHKVKEENYNRGKTLDQTPIITLFSSLQGIEFSYVTESTKLYFLIVSSLTSFSGNFEPHTPTHR